MRSVKNYLPDCVAPDRGLGVVLSNIGHVMSKPARARQPVDDEGWSALRDEMLSLFTPGAPIDEYALFAGRQPQIQKISDTVVSKGRHAVLFGERGVGKTSLASIFYLGFPETRPVVYVLSLIHI